MGFTTDTLGVSVDSPSWWAVNKESNNIDGALAFLDDILLGSYGQEMFVVETGAISAFRDVEIAPITPVSASLYAQKNANPTYSWGFTLMPSGFGQNVIGPTFELLARGAVDVDQFIELMIQGTADFAE